MKPSILALLRKLPLDLGQREVAETTQGKQIALSLVAAGGQARALDVGARCGKQTRWLEARGYQVTSIDFEPKFEDCQHVDANQPLPFEDGAFDLVWCSEVIEHLEDPARSLKELRRVTRANGQLILTTPNSYAWMFRALALGGMTPEKLQRPDHLHFFDEASIRKLAPDAELLGFFPYALAKFTIRRGVGLLSPTFVLRIQEPEGKSAEGGLKEPLSSRRTQPSAAGEAHGA